MVTSVPNCGGNYEYEELVDAAMRHMNCRVVDKTAAHDMKGALTAPDWPPLTGSEMHALADVFAAFDRPRRLLWHSPRPFSAAALVQTASATVFVKRHDARVRNVASLLEEHRFIAHLRARGSLVPAVMPSRRNGTAVAIDRWTYEVHELAAGVDAYREAHSWTPVRSLGHARALGSALAHMHLAAGGFDAPARQPRPLLAGLDIVGSAHLATALEHFVTQRPAVAAFLGTSNWRDRVLEALEPIHALLRPMLSSLDPLWVHNDWHASNLFWTDQSAHAQVSAIIDFGLCNRGIAVADLATALERNTIAWLELDVCAQDAVAGIGRVPLMQALVQGYCAVRPLQSIEREALPLFLCLAHVEYALSEVEYFHGVVGNDANARLAYRDFLLGHIQWFRARGGRQYLEALRAALQGGNKRAAA